MRKAADLIKKTEDSIKNIESKTEFDLLKHTSETRSKIANKFVEWFFYIVVWWTLSILVYNLLICLLWIRLYDKVEWPISDLLINISSALPILISAVSSPLWFVVWYYFKSETSKSN